MSQFGRSPMRQRITVQAKQETTGEFGERKVTWVDVYTDIPASVRWLTARELQAAAARQSESTVEFELRADFDITAEHRIVFQGKSFELEPPIFDQTARRFMRIKASEGVTDG